jgi:putative iron-dependent peroxidase
MTSHQVGILAPGPNLGRYLFFELLAGDEPEAAIDALAELDAEDDLVVGIGNSFVLAAGAKVDGLRGFPSLTGPGVDIPSTQSAVFCWIQADGDRGELIHRSLELELSLEPLGLSQIVDAFKHDPTPSGLGRDLSGYEDGTENPSGDARGAAAIVSGQGAGLDGSSFAAVQKWHHDLVGFQTMAEDERDNIIGRRQRDNEELENAPASAHVKRTAQESFDPEAFVVRQSMPWSDSSGEGLMFVAFGRTLDAYEAQLRRMAGLDDGIVDALFQFSRPVSGGYYWCPPVDDGKLDLRTITP